MNYNTVFVDLLNADQSLFSDIIERAATIRKNPGGYATSLLGKVLYGLYQKTSTRTHLSFGKAAASLGASYVWQSWDESNFSITDIQNEMRYVCTTADIMVARLLYNADINNLKSVTSIPLINGCCNKFHPTQAIADILTVHERLGGIKGTNWVYFGVYNNIFNSLLLAVPRMGGRLVGIVPIVNASADDPSLFDRIPDRNAVTVLRSPTSEEAREQIRCADVIYTDTWTDMEFAKNLEKAAQEAVNEARMMPFQLNRDLYGESKALIMHCMPVHIDHEITQEMVDHPKSVVFMQAANRMYGERAIIHYLLCR
jgi:ornithine carbamoyltransferase